METIFKSIAGRTDENSYQFVNLLLDPEKKILISPQEENVLIFIRDSYENSKAIPSEEFISNKFPEYRVPMSNAKVLEYSDLRIYYYNLISRRTNLNASRELMKIATEVAKGGLTYEHMDTIRSYVHITDSDEVLDSTQDAQSFREFYKAKKSQPSGMLTKIKSIDDAIGGIGYGMTMTIMGYVANFKTMLATNIVYNNVMDLKYNVCLISLEVPKEDVLFNLLCRHSYSPKFQEFPFISSRKMRDCVLTPEEEEFIFTVVLEDFYNYVDHGMLRILDETDFRTFSFGEISEMLENVDDEMLEKTGVGLDGVIVDHMHLCKFNGSGNKFGSSSEEGNAYVSFFRKKAISFRRDPITKASRKLMMLLLAQVNRDGYKRAEKSKGHYDLRAIAELNELERASQMIVSVFTTAEMKLSKEATVQLLKNRNGATVDEPQSIFVEPAAYFIGEEMDGFSDVISMTELEDVFGSSGDIADMF